MIKMFLRQLRHWKKECKKYTVQDHTEVSSILCLAIIKEVTEVLDCTDWKLHRRKRQASREELLEELIDVYKFWLCLVIHHDFDLDDIERIFILKSNLVERRAQCQE